MLPTIVLAALLSIQRAPHDALGARIAPLNDVDGDHCADFALDDGFGSAWVVSGKTGKVLARVDAEHSNEIILIAPLFGDANGDGAWDIVERHTSRTVLIRSGKDLRVVLELSLPKDQDGFVGVPAAAGDWNSDGVPDVAATVVRDRLATIVVFSGKDGRVLRTIGEGSEWSKRVYLHRERLVLHSSCCANDSRPASFALPLGPSRGVILIRHDSPDAIELPFCDQSSWLNSGIGFVGDVDGDGSPDLVIRTYSERANSTVPLVHMRATNDPHSSDYAPRLVLISGRTGKDLEVLPDADFVGTEGLAATRIADLDGDGIGEILVGNVDWIGFAMIFSGKDRRMLWKLSEDPECCAGCCRFGANVTALGDVDGDGIADFAITSSSGVDEIDPGCVAIYSGKTRQRLRSIWRAGLSATESSPADKK